MIFTERLQYLNIGDANIALSQGVFIGKELPIVFVTNWLGLRWNYVSIDILFISGCI